MNYTYLGNGCNDPVIIEPKVFEDNRGYFFESFRMDEFQKEFGNVQFVQENESCSSYGVFRGMHFQKPPYAQAKLVKVAQGVVMDFAVDLRKNSKNYGKLYQAYLSEHNKKQFFIPRGFAHGFLCLCDKTIFQYKCDNYYNKESEGGILYSSIDGLKEKLSPFVKEEELVVSQKDKIHEFFSTFVSPFILEK